MKNDGWGGKRICAILIFVFVLGCWLLWRDFEEYRHHAIPYMMYHSIGVVPGWDADLCVSQEFFEAQLKYLRDDGFAVITADEARERLLSGRDVYKNVAFTFDDGYMNNYETALPLLKKYGARASFYVVGKLVGQKGYMDYSELRKLIAAGMEVGSHTMSHDPLAVIDAKYLPWEIYQPLNLFSKELGIKVRGIAFPNGSYNKEVLDEIDKYNGYYKYGLTGKPGCNTQELLTRSPYDLRRLGVYMRGDPETVMRHRLFKAYVAGYIESKGMPVEWIYEVVQPEISLDG